MDETQFRALPERQRKAEQERLQGLGLYPAGARLDGAWGPSTDAAYALENKRAAEEARAARDAGLEEKRLEIEKLKATGAVETSTAAAKKTEAEAAAATAKAARREVYNRQASSPEGITAQSAATLAAPALGTAGGLRFGQKVNERMNAGQEKRNVTLREAADDRVKGLTTREGAVTGTKLSGAMPFKSAVMRTTARMAPHLALGAISAGKGAYVLNDYDEEQPFYPRMADRAAGLGYIGFGTGLAKMSVEHGASPGVSPDVKALSIINSSQLRRNNSAGEPDAKPAAASTLAALRKEAQDLQLPGRSKLTTKNQLQLALENFRNNAKNLPKSAMLGPLAAGTLAYSATPDRAQAGTGEAGSDRSEAATNALAAGGIAYGAQKGLNAIPKGGGAMFTGLNMPSTIDAMTDYTPEEVAQGDELLARNLPSWARFGRVEDAYQRITPAPGNPSYPLSNQLQPETRGYWERHRRGAPPMPPSVRMESENLSLPENNPVHAPDIQGPIPGEEVAAPPKNALDAAGRVPTEFGTALQEFLAMVKEMQAEMQAEQGQGAPIGAGMPMGRGY